VGEGGKRGKRGIGKVRPTPQTPSKLELALIEVKMHLTIDSETKEDYIHFKKG